MYTFIINPHARSGLGSIVWNELELLLKERGIAYDAFFTEYQRHATKIVRSLTSDGRHHTIIALGGDGTINEVINGITNLSLVTLGYIPIGSSNDFSRFFHFPKDPKQCLLQILEGETITHMHVGLLKIGTRTRRFAVSSGFGFDASICHVSVVSNLKSMLNKLKLGRLTYVGIALRQLFLARPYTVTLTLDDNDPLTFTNTLFVTAMNHPYEGGGFKFCPDADPCDDTLDIILVSGLSKWNILRLLPLAYSGKHANKPGVFLARCKKASIKSTQFQAIHTDGEAIPAEMELSFSLQKETLQIITK